MRKSPVSSAVTIWPLTPIVQSSSRRPVLSTSATRTSVPSLRPFPSVSAWNGSVSAMSS